MKKFYLFMLGLSLPFIAIAGLETGTYISDLVVTNPTGADDYATADDHIRLLKSTTKNTFPNITGAVLPTQVELNLLDGLTGTVWTSDNDGAASTLDADLLDGNSSAFFQNANNINAGTLAVARLDATVLLDGDIGSLVQAFDAQLADIAGLAVTDNNFIVSNGTNWVAETGATARASLGVSIGSDVQAFDAGLDAIAGLAVTNGNFIVGNGTTWVAESGATARTSIGAAATSHNHAAGDITSGTLPLTRGGTGQTTIDNVAEQVFLQCTIASDPGTTPNGSPGDCWLYY